MTHIALEGPSSPLTTQDNRAVFVPSTTVVPDMVSRPGCGPWCRPTQSTFRSPTGWRSSRPGAGGSSQARFEADFNQAAAPSDSDHPAPAFFLSVSFENPEEGASFLTRMIRRKNPTAPPPSFLDFGPCPRETACLPERAWRLGLTDTRQLRCSRRGPSGLARLPEFPEITDFSSLPDARTLR